MQTKLIKFIENITPVWFTWLGWLLAIGAVGYIAETTKAPSIGIIYIASYVFFFVYITNTISRLMDFKLLKSERLNKLVTLLLAITVMSVSTLALHQALSVLVVNN